MRSLRYHYKKVKKCVPLRNGKQAVNFLKLHKTSFTKLDIITFIFSKYIYVKDTSLISHNELVPKFAGTECRSFSIISLILSMQETKTEDSFCA